MWPQGIWAWKHLPHPLQNRSVPVGWLPHDVMGHCSGKFNGLWRGVQSGLSQDCTVWPNVTPSLRQLRFSPVQCASGQLSPVPLHFLSAVNGMKLQYVMSTLPRLLDKESDAASARPHPLPIPRRNLQDTHFYTVCSPSFLVHPPRSLPPRPIPPCLPHVLSLEICFLIKCTVNGCSRGNKNEGYEAFAWGVSWGNGNTVRQFSCLTTRSHESLAHRSRWEAKHR